MTTYYTKRGKRYVEANPYTELDASVLIIAGVRYTLGRASYSPSCAMAFCRDHWQLLGRNTRHVIMRDVMDWLGGEFGKCDMAYPDEWREFLRWCFAQNADEAHSAASANVWQRDRMTGVDEFFGVLDKAKTDALAADGVAYQDGGKQ